MQGSTSPGGLNSEMLLIDPIFPRDLPLKYNLGQEKGPGDVKDSTKVLKWNCSLTVRLMSIKKTKLTQGGAVGLGL
jgi:hypothetical protein